MPISSPGQDASEEEWDTYFETHGEPKIRMLFENGGWPQSLQLRTVQWLARKAAAREATKSALDAEQIEIARSAKDAAWASARAADRAAVAAEKANKRSIVALVVATLSIALTAFSAALVHWDTIHLQH